MNKPICILLCILLISLSVVPVFATDYEYSIISEFCSAFESARTYPYSTNTNTFFIDSLPSDFQPLLEKFFNTYTDYELDDISFIRCSGNSSNINLEIHIDNFPIYNSYYTTSGGYVTYRYYFQQSTTMKTFVVSYNISNSTFSTNQYADYTATESNTQFPDSTFYGIYPVNITISPSTTNNFTNRYILNYETPINPTPEDASYIIMDRPPDIYVALLNSFNSAYATKLRSEFPNEYANVPNDQILVDDHNLAAIWCALQTNTGVMESYMNHSYDFYDNVSYNLASLCNSYNDISNGINKLVEVYASDQEVAAREAASDNQQSIVDNFLDSEGEGYVSPSDISSVSYMSDGYKTNMSTDAQPSGIWDIFNSNHFGWFSQETVNQLDTSTSNQRGSNIFETPYLDEKIKDIYRSLGVNYDD